MDKPVHPTPPEDPKDSVAVEAFSRDMEIYKINLVKWEKDEALARAEANSNVNMKTSNVDFKASNVEANVSQASSEAKAEEKDGEYNEETI